MSDPRFKLVMAITKAPEIRLAGRGKPSGEAAALKLIQHTIIVSTIYGPEAEQFILQGTDPNDKVRANG